jgi:uracil-DNA glycosylase
MTELEISFEANRERIVSCALCPRLVAWREGIGQIKRRSYASEEYWARPVPDFGDPKALRLIVGLAPAAHGGNRTGLMFHGDRSGDWLYRALHKAGVAKLPKADSVADGQELYGVLISATCHCAPPDNKPTREEILSCRPYLQEMLASRPWQSILCLGSIAWENVLKCLDEKRRPFGHGVTHTTESGIRIVGSYHPSQQNTFTGKLTEQMLDEAVEAFLQP